MQGKDFVGSFVDCEIHNLEIDSVSFTAMPYSLLPSCVFNENTPHRFRCRSEEVATTVPMLRLVYIDKPNVGFMHQSGSLQRFGLLI